MRVFLEASLRMVVLVVMNCHFTLSKGFMYSLSQIIKEKAHNSNWNSNKEDMGITFFISF